jgi:hypothetical protein
VINLVDDIKLLIKTLRKNGYNVIKNEDAHKINLFGIELSYAEGYDIGQKTLKEELKEKLCEHKRVCKFKIEDITNPNIDTRKEIGMWVAFDFVIKMLDDEWVVK